MQFVNQNVIIAIDGIYCVLFIYLFIATLIYKLSDNSFWHVFESVSINVHIECDDTDLWALEFGYHLKKKLWDILFSKSFNTPSLNSSIGLETHLVIYVYDFCIAIFVRLHAELWFLFSDYFPSIQKAHYQLLLQVMFSLQNDIDRDVRHFAHLSASAFNVLPPKEVIFILIYYISMFYHN